MFKKIPILFVVLCALIGGCATPAAPSSGSCAPSTPSICLPAPPQPIAFSSLDAALEFIQEPDYTPYQYHDSSWIQAYEQMTSRFRSVGFLYKAISGDPQQAFDYHPGRVPTLYPEVTHEDSGVSWWIDYNGKSYQLIVYHTQNLEPMPGGDFLSYFTMRFGHPYNHEISKQVGSYHCYFQPYQEELRACAAIDGQHYFRIRSFGTQQELEALIGILRFTKETVL